MRVIVDVLAQPGFIVAMFDNGIGDVVTGTHTVSGHHRQYGIGHQRNAYVWIAKHLADTCQLPLNLCHIQRGSAQIHNQQGFKRTHVSQCFKASRNGFRHNPHVTDSECLTVLVLHRAHDVRFFAVDVGHVRLCVCVEIFAQWQGDNHIHFLWCDA